MSDSRMVRLAGVLVFYVLALFVTSSAFAQCNVLTPIGPNDSVAGTLANGDCTIQELVGGGDDTTFVDIYQVVLPSPGTLTIRQESNVIDSFLVLLDNVVDQNVIATDDDGGVGANSLIVQPLAAGTYIILANSFDPETGPYTLTTTCDCAPILSASLVASVLPSSRSVQVGDTATAFATIINLGPGTATACGIALPAGLPADFLFQTTDPATNALSGTPDTPVDIAAGAAQSFVFAITPTAPFSPTDVQFLFDCTNTNPANNVPGLNTLVLSASNTPTPDIVALAATLSNDGIVEVSGTGVFAVATVNVGASGTIIVSADTGNAVLPVSISVCETNPISGACLAPPVSAAGSVTTQIDSGETSTFAFFVAASGNVPLDPAVNRIFVRFKDSGGAVRGATSVAVQTQ